MATARYHAATMPADPAPDGTTRTSRRLALSRRSLPAFVTDLLADREAVVQDGRREADRILERARAQADRMVSEHEVYLAAVEEANELHRRTSAETALMRKETDDYIDAKLATFEMTLHKTLQTVDRGRERLRSQMYDELAAAPEGQEPYDDGDDRR